MTYFEFKHCPDHSLTHFCKPFAPKMCTLFFTEVSVPLPLSFSTTKTRVNLIQGCAVSHFSLFKLWFYGNPINVDMNFQMLTSNLLNKEQKQACCHTKLKAKMHSLHLRISVTHLF